MTRTERIANAAKQIRKQAEMLKPARESQVRQMGEAQKKYDAQNAQ